MKDSRELAREVQCSIINCVGIFAKPNIFGLAFLFRIYSDIRTINIFGFKHRIAPSRGTPAETSNNPEAIGSKKATLRKLPPPRPPQRTPTKLSRNVAADSSSASTALTKFRLLTINVCTSRLARSMEMP